MRACRQLTRQKNHNAPGVAKFDDVEPAIAASPLVGSLQLASLRLQAASWHARSRSSWFAGSCVQQRNPNPRFGAY